MRGLSVVARKLSEAQRERDSIRTLLGDAEALGDLAATVLDVPADAGSRLATLDRAVGLLSDEHTRLSQQQADLESKITDLSSQEAAARAVAKDAPRIALEQARADVLAEVSRIRQRLIDAALLAQEFNCEHRLLEVRSLVQPISGKEVLGNLTMINHILALQFVPDHLMAALQSGNEGA